MSKLSAFLALDWRYRILVIESFALLGISRIAVLALPFRWIASRLGTHMAETSIESDLSLEEVQALKRVTWAVRRIRHYTPWNSNCLAQALAAKTMLARRGINSTIYFGVMKNKEEMLAHAWLRSGKVIVIGGKEMKMYTVVGTFAGEAK